MEQPPGHKSSLKTLMSIENLTPVAQTDSLRIL